MPKILIVEDEADLRQAYEQVLSHHGYDVICAGDGSEGLRKTADLKPDLVLLDIIMPVMDGVEYMRRLSEAGNSPKILVFSNIDALEQINEALLLGADGSIIKSHCTPRQMVSVVEEHLQA